jgi:hypothetical protein
VNNLSDDFGMSPMSMMAGDPANDPPEHDSAAAVAIELLGGSTIDQALPEKKRRIPDSAMLLLMVIVVAGGGLFAMRQMGLGSQIQFTNVKIDYPLEGIAMGSDEHDLLEDLRNKTVEQVPLNQVQKNPFQLLSDAHTVTDFPIAIAGESAEEAGRRREAEERQRLIVRTYTNLDLNSVLLGSVPVARISGKTVRVGDWVEGLFRVREISARAVNLEVDGKLYTLSLGE